MKAPKPAGETLSSSLEEHESSHAFVERLRELTAKAGSVTAFAKAAGLSQSGFQRYLAGSEPSRKALIAIAKAGGVSTQWLVQGGAAEQKVESQSQDVLPDGMPEGAIVDDYAFVPLYDAQCSAGSGSWNEGCRVLTHISFTRYSLRKQGLTPDHLSAIRVDGESMEPILHSGDTVLIDHTRVTVEGEGIYVLRMDGHLYAKKLQRQLDGVAIISANKEYEKIVVPRDRLDELEIVGRAVWSAGWL